MDFNQARQFYARLKQQYDREQITVEEFERQVNEVVVTDENGVEWQIGVSSGKWYRFDGQGWMEDVPMEFKRSSAAIPARAVYVPPPSPVEPDRESIYQNQDQPRKNTWASGLLIVGISGACCVVLAIGGWLIWRNTPAPNPFTPPIVTSPANPSVAPFIPPTTAGVPSAASTEPIAGPGFDPNSPPFFDDFSNPASGWNRERTDDHVTDYENGSYRIQVNKANWAFWANPSKNFESDVYIEVDAAKVGGPNENGFGVICRYQDENNYYRFMISSDGLIVISMKKNGDWSNLSSDVWEPSDAIHQGAESNHIRAECIGDGLKLLVNDQFAASATDSSFTSGDVGLIASAYDTPGVDILFDNFSASSR